MAVEYVVRNGRRIEVETLPDPPGVAAKLRKREKRKQQAFVMIPLWWAERGGLPEILVCADLLRRAWEAKGKSFPLPNRRDVDPKVKYRILRELEESELIKVEWRTGKSPLITMTPPIS
jgi:hypothetical protein